MGASVSVAAVKMGVGVSGCVGRLVCVSACVCEYLCTCSCVSESVRAYLCLHAPRCTRFPTDATRVEQIPPIPAIRFAANNH